MSAAPEDAPMAAPDAASPSAPGTASPYAASPAKKARSAEPDAADVDDADADTNVSKAGGGGTQKHTPGSSLVDGTDQATADAISAALDEDEEDGDEGEEDVAAQSADDGDEEMISDAEEEDEEEEGDDDDDDDYQQRPSGGARSGTKAAKNFNSRNSKGYAASSTSGLAKAPGERMSRSQDPGAPDRNDDRLLDEPIRQKYLTELGDLFLPPSTASA